MKEDRNILLKLVFPVFILVIITVAQTQAADNTENNMKGVNDMPAAPVGPYRSTYGSNKSLSITQFDSRQWTAPAPSHWEQQSHSATPQPVNKKKNKKQWLQQSMSAAQPALPLFNNKQRIPPVPPQWVQPQRRQVRVYPPVPPQWAQQQRRQVRVYPTVPPQWIQQQRRQMRVYPPVPSQWAQQQRRQMRVYPPVPSQWVQQQRRHSRPYYPNIPPAWGRQQRRQVPVYPPNSSQWRHQRVVVPPLYRRPSVWGHAPYPQYRHQ